MEVDELHQFVPTMLANDAVGAHVLLMRDLLRANGLRSEIFAGAADDASAPLVRPYREFPGGPAIYQFAVGDDLAEFAATRADHLVVNSHNVTPPAYFAPWGEPELVIAAERGLRQLDQLADVADAGLAVSSFNAAGLRDAGFTDVAVAPLLVQARVDGPIDVALVERLRSTRRAGSVDWLFVGRIVPNKAQLDLVNAFAHYRREVDGGARLWLVGRTDSPSYERAVRRLITELGCGGSAVLTGSIPGPALSAHLANADVFVGLSEHEGFGVPLVEAMRWSLPVVVHDAGAVAETLGGAGLLLADKAPATVAAAVAEAVEPAQRARLIALGRARADELSTDRTGAQNWEAIDRWLAGW